MNFFNLRSILNLSLIFFVEFLDYFGLFSTSKLGGICCVDIAPSLESKIGSKEPQNRLKLISEIGSYTQFETLVFDVGFVPK